MRSTLFSNRQSGQAGFTLVEVLVGTLLIAIVFTAAYSSYFIGLKMVDESRQEVRAAQIIQSEMERLRTMNWTDMTNMSSSLITPQGEFVKEFADEFEVYRQIDDLNTIQKQITIWVSWTNGSGQKTFRCFTLVYTKNGLNDYYYRQA